MVSTPVAVVDVSALALGPLDIGLRMMLAMLIGAVIGTEREYTHRPAGMRTHMLVALGACAVMTTSQMIFWQYRPYGATPDPARLSAQVLHVDAVEQGVRLARQGVDQLQGPRHVGAGHGKNVQRIAVMEDLLLQPLENDQGGS